MTLQKREEIEKFFKLSVNDKIAVTLKGWDREHYSDCGLSVSSVFCSKTRNLILYTQIFLPTSRDLDSTISHVSQKFPINQVYMYLGSSAIYALDSHGILKDIDRIPYESTGFFRIMDFYKQPLTIKKKITV